MSNPYDPTTPHNYGPPQTPKKPHHWYRPRNVFGGIIGFILLIVIITVAASCGSSPKTTNHVQAGSAQPAATQPAYPQGGPTCTQQLTTWRDNGGLTEADKLGDANKTMGTDAAAVSQDLNSDNGRAADDDNALLDDTAAIAGITGNIKLHMPPSCVTGLDRDYGSAVDHDQKSAIYLMQAIGAINKGDTLNAVVNVGLANQELNAAVTAVNAAATDIDTFNQSSAA